MKVVLDTNAASALMHRLPEALARLKARRPGELYLTSPVAAEIHFGLERLPSGSRRRTLLEAEYQRLRSAVRWQDWNEDAAVEFGRQKARLERLGQSIQDMDIVIGAIAISLGARVATYNVRHLERLEGLEVEDWSG